MRPDRNRFSSEAKEIGRGLAPATVPAAVATATTATATATATTAGRSGARRAFLRLIDAQWPASHLEAVRLLDRVLGFTGRHVHKRESPGTPRLAIVDELYRFYFSVAFEQAAYFVFCCCERQVANVNRRHSTGLTDIAHEVRARPHLRAVFNTQTVVQTP